MMKKQQQRRETVESFIQACREIGDAIPVMREALIALRKELDASDDWQARYDALATQVEAAETARSRHHKTQADRFELEQANERLLAKVAVALRERDEARAEVERLRGIVEVNDRRLAAVWDESRAEVEMLREALKTAGDRLRACAHELTEHSYQEIASVLFDLPTSAEEAP